MLGQTGRLVATLPKSGGGARRRSGGGELALEAGARAPGSGGDDLLGRPMIWDGRYRLTRTLGEGGMGRVMLAHDLMRAQRPVALKILLPEFLDTISEFLHEYTLQRRLSHPNIPRAYDLGFANQPRATFPYFAMEYCRGVPIAAALRNKPTLREVVEIFGGLLRALDHIHRGGLIHGDIKPGNLLVAQTGSELHSWLIDFGVAAPLGGFSDDDVFIGTPEYAAPELMLGVGVDERADLYAVGLMLYELIEGRRPWLGSDETELLMARRAGPPPPLTAPECPSPLADLVRRLLDPEPARRPASASRVLAELSHVLGTRARVETPEAFVRRLRHLPHPYEADVRPHAAALLDGLRSGAAPSRGPMAVIVEGPQALDPRRLVDGVADRASILGARVLRATPTATDQGPLATIAPVLASLGRLYPQLIDLLEADPGPVSAARALAGSGRPIVLVVDGLERVDAASLQAMYAALTRRGSHVRLVGSCDLSGSAELSPELLALLVHPAVVHLALGRLEPSAMALWLDGAVGAGVVPDDERPRLLDDAQGTTQGLVRGLFELFRRGRIERSLDGYVQGAPLPTALRDERVLVSKGPVGELDALLACVLQPVPEVALRRYLREHASALAELIANGVVVVIEDEGVAVEDEPRRAAVYGRLPEARRRRLHRRLAVAIEESRPDDRVAISREYRRSDTPLLAVAHLVEAAREAPRAGRADQARVLIDRAEAILRSHEGDSSALDLWRFWSLLWRADARVSLTTGDIDRFEAVVEALVRLGTDMAHRQTLRAALEFRLKIGERRGAWDQLVDDAGALLALDPSGPSADGLARLRWAKAMRYRARGDADLAADQLERALVDEDRQLSSDVRLLIQLALATHYVDLQWHDRAHGAVEAYLGAARACDSGHDIARARTLAASLLRHTARPARALSEVRLLMKELRGERVPGVDGMVEWELARCHLEFGWFASARDHALQAQAMAADDGDPVLQVRAMLAEAAALRHLQGRDDAWQLVQRAATIRGAGASATVNARLSSMELALEVVGHRGQGEIAREASELGWRAHRRREGARAARAFALAARAAVERRDPALAVQWATLALKNIERNSVEHVHRPRHLALASEAHRLAGDEERAARYLTRATAELGRIAGLIEDPELRAAWLANPRHAALAPLLEAIEAVDRGAPERRRRRAARRAQVIEALELAVPGRRGRARRPRG